MYKLSFDFPYGTVYLKSIYIDDVLHSVEIPEFTANIDEAKIFNNKTEAEGAGRFFGNKYKYSIVEI